MKSPGKRDCTTRQTSVSMCLRKLFFSHSLIMGKRQQNRDILVVRTIARIWLICQAKKRACIESLFVAWLAGILPASGEIREIRHA